LVMKTLKDEWYVVTKAYKLTDFEIFARIVCRAIPTYRVY